MTDIARKVGPQPRAPEPLRSMAPRSTHGRGWERRWFSPRTVRRLSSGVLVTGLGLVVMLVFLMPLGYMLATAFKQDTQLTTANAPLWPAQAATYSYQGQDYP